MKKSFSENLSTWKVDFTAQTVCEREIQTTKLNTDTLSLKWAVVHPEPVFFV